MEAVLQLRPWLTSWFDGPTDCECWPANLDEVDVYNNDDQQQESAVILTAVTMTLGIAGLFFCINLFNSANKSRNKEGTTLEARQRRSPTALIMIKEQQKRELGSLAKRLFQMPCSGSMEWERTKLQRRSLELKQRNAADKWKDAVPTSDDEMERSLPLGQAKEWHDPTATTDDEVEPALPARVIANHRVYMPRIDDTFYEMVTDA